MSFEYKWLNGIQTELITWGNPFNCDGSEVVICITGNPGVPDFYLEFGTELHKITGMPVCVVGQAGHVHVPDYSSNILNGKNHLFDLEGQINHKLDLINNHIDKRSKLHLIGHSIGAWMTLELLHRHITINERTSSVNLLFPTLQMMAETKNGKVINGIFRKINFMIILIFGIAFLLPDAVNTFCIELYYHYYLKINSFPSHYVERTKKYINPSVMEKVLFLAYDEMDKVRELNIDALEKNKHLMNVIYSNRDGWAPVSYMDELKPLQPHLQMKEVDINHAFVLKYSEEVAEMVAKFIKH